MSRTFTFTDRQVGWLQNGLSSLWSSLTGEEFDDPADQAVRDREIAEVEELAFLIRKDRP